MTGLGWMGLASLAAAAAAGVAILGRVGLQNVDTVLATMLRSMVMALAVIAVATTTGRFGDLLTGRAVINARAWGFVVAAGICGAVSWLAYFAALRLGPAGPVAALDRLSLPIVFILGVALLGETAGWRGWSGLVMIVLGTGLIVWDQLASAAA